MKRFTKISLYALAFIILWQVNAQSLNRIENFTLTDVTSKQSISLADYKNQKGVVLIFTSNICPYAKLYEGRIQALGKEFAGKDIQFLLINSNIAAEDNGESIEQMAYLAQQNNYSFPYLADKDHKVATMFGALKTPEAIVLQNTGGIFTIKYRGAIDDNPQMPNDVSAQYLKEAIQAVMNQSNLSTVERRPTGCMIQKK